MRPRVDLDLVRQSLQQLNESTYFERRLHDFTAHLISAIDHVLAGAGTYDLQIETQFAAVVRAAQTYLTGSTTNEVPYEVVYCLNDALKRWDPRPTVIVTRLSEGQDFHFNPVDPWQLTKKALSGFDSSGFDQILVLIGVPRLYAHKPIFCVPLYHELGHYIDIAHSVSDVTLLQTPRRLAAPSHDERLHRLEYFADLFAASFVGTASTAALEAIAPNRLATRTHPVTTDRVALVADFLAGRQNEIVVMFQSALAARSLRQLKSERKRVSVGEAFDDLRTFVAKDTDEVHGLFESAWRYMFDAIDAKQNPWNLGKFEQAEVVSVTNDLAEKSIRNFAIKALWNASPSA